MSNLAVQYLLVVMTASSDSCSDTGSARLRLGVKFIRKTSSVTSNHERGHDEKCILNMTAQSSTNLTQRLMCQIGLSGPLNAGNTN